MLSRPLTNGSSLNGSATSNARPTSMPEKSAGVTPMIDTGTPSNRQPPADHVRRAAEMALPETVADHHHRTSGAAARPIVVFGERAAEQRAHPKRLEKRSGRPDAVDELRFSAGCQVERGSNSIRPPSRRVPAAAGSPPRRGMLHPLGFRLAALDSSTSRPGSGTGSVRSRRLLTSEKIAVLAPMPSASDSMATIDTTGVARRDLSASVRSVMRFQISEFRFQIVFRRNLKSEL